jgi:thioesterase domain-containing protein/acyl carrier protein
VEEVPEEATTVPIGRPIANTQAYVLDERMQPVPVGVSGELYLGGDGLARGYWNRPELTAEKFVPDPFHDGLGARLYRTGDRVRWGAGGQLQFLGRRDHQVKLRGFRIELGEIELVLGQHSQVHQAVVRLREDRPGDRRLVAYVVPREGHSRPRCGELLQFLQEKLPDYMVPSGIILLDRLPLTANGKVDWRALPSPGLEVGGESEAASPRTPVQKRLARIWQELLHRGPIGIHDSFFALGGHSLLAVRLAARIEEEFGQKLSLSTIFQKATVSQLASALAGSQEIAPGVSMVEIRPGGPKEPLFVLPSLGNEVVWCQPVVRHLSTDRPIWGLQPSPENDAWVRAADLEAMAARYVEALCRVYPVGPCHLIGYSFAGMLAYEVARQLGSRQRPVHLLGIIDTGPVHLGRSSLVGDVCWLASFVLNLPFWIWDDLAHSSLREMMTRVRLAVARIWRQRVVPDRSGAPRWQLQDLFNPTLLSLSARETLEHNLHTFFAYVPKPCPGRITLFLARTRPLFGSFSPDLGWGDLVAGGVEVRTVPGHHESILKEPHARALAVQIRAALAEIEEM